MRTVRLWAGCARGEREVVVASDPRIKSGGKQSSGTSGDSCSPGSPRRFAARDDDAGHPDKGLERLRIVAFGWGNDARGDDGLGPLLLGRLARADYGNVTTIEDFQLQIEHALDLDGAELSLFIDAGKGTPAPFAFAEIVARRDPSHTTHALSPAALLDACAARASSSARACRPRAPSVWRRRGRSFRSSCGRRASRPGGRRSADSDLATRHKAVAAPAALYGDKTLVRSTPSRGVPEQDCSRPPNAPFHRPRKKRFSCRPRQWNEKEPLRTK